MTVREDGEVAGGTEVPPAGVVALAQEEGGTEPPRRRRRRGGRGRARSSTGQPATAEPDEGSGDGTIEPDARAEDGPHEADRPDMEAGSTFEGTGAAARRRRRRRGGRGRSRSRTAAGTETAEMADAEIESAGPEGAEEAEPARTTTRSLSARTSVPRAAVRERAEDEAADAAEAVGGDEEAVEGMEPPARRRRRRRRRSTSATAVEAGAPAAEPEPGPRRPAARARAVAAAPREAPASERGAPAATEPGTERPGRARRARPFSRRRREAAPVLRRAADKSMLITEIGERDQIAVLEDRALVEHFITRAGARSMVGNIYLAKVQNVLPGMEAAFLDVGRGRNAVLYAGEVSYDEDIDGQSPRIEQVLKAGQKVLVQVTKDPMGGKGARLTQEISLPGRYVVLVPNSQVFGVSRRLPDTERGRLKDILRRIRPPQHGLIVRTAAEDASAEDLEADLRRLNEEWEAIERSSKRGRAPRLLYEEPELTIRVIRDHATESEFREIVTDSSRLYDLIVSYLQGVAPDLVPKVQMYRGRLPLLEEYHALEQIHKALDRKVWLSSGGYIVIDKTEALTVIDVNTGKHVGKANLEETVTKTNLEAAQEIARQLRLRDIGGIIIVDFIDMLYERNREKVIQTLTNALAEDKTRSQVFGISPLGLLEVTRKRVSAGLLESFSETCPTCEGRGILLTHNL